MIVFGRIIFTHEVLFRCNRNKYLTVRILDRFNFCDFETKGSYFPSNPNISNETFTTKYSLDLQIFSDNIQHL